MGKRYDVENGTGLMLRQEITTRLAAMAMSVTAATLTEPGAVATGSQPNTHPTLGPTTLPAIYPHATSPNSHRPTSGQDSFRALVTDAYRYRCAISSERTLPVLQAAHIRPYAEGGQHELSNGLLLRSDLHTLFDQHYLTIEPNKKMLIVSRRNREQFENGRDYYALNKRPLSQPADVLALPSTDNLVFHFERFSELENV